MKKRKFSKTGLALVGSMIICVILFLAVGVPNGFFGDSGRGGNLDDENTPGIKEVIEEGTPILIFDKSNDAKALMAAFDEGKIKSAVVVAYKNGGSKSFETKDQARIRKIYKAMKNMVVIGESKDAKAQNNISICFRFGDGTKYGYSFEGKNIIQIGEKTYKVSGSEDLWKLITKGI